MLGKPVDLVVIIHLIILVNRFKTPEWSVCLLTSRSKAVYAWWSALCDVTEGTDDQVMPLLSSQMSAPSSLHYLSNKISVSTIPKNWEFLQEAAHSGLNMFEYEHILFIYSQ